MPKRVETCPSCGWRHDGDEREGIEVFDDSYYICLLTQEKVLIKDAVIVER